MVGMHGIVQGRFRADRFTGNGYLWYNKNMADIWKGLI